MRKVVVNLTISYDVDETDLLEGSDEEVKRLETYLWRNHTNLVIKNKWGDALKLDNLSIEDISVEMDKTV